MYVHHKLSRFEMSFLRKKPSTENEVGGQHRVRIQMQLHTYPTASFELPVDVSKTPSKCHGSNIPFEKTIFEAKFSTILRPP